jgi:hypothetical protein
MSRFPFFQCVQGLLVSALFLTPAWSQEPNVLGKGGSPSGQKAAADVEPGASIFNGELKRFKFALEDLAVTSETAEEFMVRYQGSENPRILGAFPDTKTNSLFVIGPPEAEPAIRLTLAESIINAQGLVGAPSLDLQLRVLQQERKKLLFVMADLEIQEVAAAAGENGPQKAKQLADRRKLIEDELKIAEQQIRIVRKYMARLAEDDSAPGGAASP